jgi:surface antigen
VLSARTLAVTLAILIWVAAGITVDAQPTNPYDAWYVDDTGLSRSNCTFWAWQRWLDVHGVALPRWGNAGEWAGSASAAGFVLSDRPQPGSIVVTWESPLGHVAFVEAVDPDDPDHFRVSEYGFDAGIGLHERWLTTDGSLQFILPPVDASSVSFPGDGTGGPPQPGFADGTSGPPGALGLPVQ